MSKLRVFIIRLVLSFLLVAASETAVADVIAFDPDGLAPGNGVLQISGFNFAPGNALAQNVFPINPGRAFQFMQQMSVASLRDSAGNPITPPGLNTSFEITVVINATWLVTSYSTTPQVRTASMTMAPVQSAASFVEIWYDPTPDANPLTGTGYNDGQRVFVGIPSGSDAMTIVEQLNPNGTPDISAFDQFGTNDYPSISTIRAFGSGSGSATVLSRDGNFFLSAVQGMKVNSSNFADPFTSTNPSAVFAGMAGGAQPLTPPILGPVNGNSAPDWQLQSNGGNASFTLPKFIVTTTADHDDGSCSAADCTLREAIRTANEQGGSNSIAFAFGLSGAINLASTLPTVTSNLTIDGPGADVLTVRRDTGGNYRLLFLDNGTNSGPRVTIRGLTLSNGLFPGSNAAGGCIYNDFGTLRLERCAISGNSAGLGGAIYNFRGSVTLVDSTINNNAATSGDGGAFYNNAAQGPASFTLSNCTISGNSATNTTGTARGAVVYNPGTTGSASVTLLNCTLAGNSAPSGGIVGNGSMATVSLQNTILSAGATGANIAVANSAVVTSQGGNLSSDAAGGDGSSGPGGFLNQTGDKRNTDPKLDPAGLLNNGGPTATIALQSGSPAINAGKAANSPPFDQRGFGRNGVVDIGAFEFGGINPNPPGTLGNISTRLRVETGDNVLIGGFIVTGTQPKKVILRAIGPSLNLPGQLSNPTLELYQGSSLIASNDDWQNQPAADRQAVIDSTVPPSNDLEAALVRTLPANGTAYTAIVRGVNSTTGIGVVEAFDLDTAADSRLANISTRGFVQTGDNVLIAGTIIVGQTPQKVLVRGIGPSLPIPGKMEDPTLELRDSNGSLLQANDNWVDSPDKQAIIDTTIPPADNRESAIVATLPSNTSSYTAILRGVNDTTGIAVVEVFALN